MAYEAQIVADLKSMGIADEDADLISQSFIAVDVDQNGFVDKDEVGNLLEMVRKPTPMYKIRTLMTDLDTDKDGVLNPKEFSQIYLKVTADELAKTFKKAVTTKSGISVKGGLSESSAEGTQHSYSDEECLAFSNWIVKHLKDDPDCGKLVEGMSGEDLFKHVGDGILLCKLINHSAPDTIDERTINKKNLNIYKKQENLNLALNSASSIGCNIVNIGGVDILEGKPHLILGLIWQVIRIGLFAKIDLTRTPDLVALLREGEELEDLMNLSPEELLLRWMNYHLEKSEGYQAKSGKQITNFSGDIKDSIAYCYLLEQIQPIDEELKQYELVPPIAGGEDCAASTNLARAESMLQSADRLGCREFVTPKDITKGNSKLNMAFVANLFNTHPALKADIEIEQEIIDETREVKTYRNWMNSLGVSPRVNKMFRDLGDGLVLLQLYDNIQEGVVEWKKVTKPPYPKLGGNMKKTENCNYAVDVAKTMGYKIVGIGGSDIQDGNENLTLAVVWQVMRGYTLKILQRLSDSECTTSDPEIVAWVNKTLEEGGKSTRITSFKDPSISTSHVIVDLIDCIKPDSVNYEIVRECQNDDDKMSNAKYAISMARKIGSRIYALPEDLVEVKPKMVLTVFACLMGTGLKKDAM